MQQIITIVVFPFAFDAYGEEINASAYDQTAEGWSVYSSDGDEITDEQSFHDFASASKYAQALAVRYGVAIDHRY